MYRTFLSLHDHFEIWSFFWFGTGSISWNLVFRKSAKKVLDNWAGGENEYDGDDDGSVKVVMMISLAPQLFTLSVLSSRPFFSLQSLNMMVVMTMRVPVQELFRHISALFMIVGKRWHYINGEAKIMIPVRFTSNENGTKSKIRNRPTFNKEIQHF